MKLLAFETATRRISAALMVDGNVIERSADMPNSGSEVLLPWANAMLAEAGLGFGQLDGIAFGAGPGGFTGLRLACGVAQGLAFGLDRPVVPVSTLEALALAAVTGRGGAETTVWAVLDARMRELYSALYCVRDARVTELSAPVCLAPAVLPAPTLAAGIAVGDGFAAYPGVLAGAAQWQLIPDCWPTAEAVARLAAPVLAAGQGQSAAQAQPRYVRDKVALTTAERLAQGGLR